MRSLLALILCAATLTAASAYAETRVFIIVNQADGYGIARTYCQSRDFAQASAYRRVDPDEITGSVPNPAQTAPMAVATNMSQSPASAEFARNWRALGPIFGP
jgi:hypothetical protein